MTSYGIHDGRTIEVNIPRGWAICCACGDMWLLAGPGHVCAYGWRLVPICGHLHPVKYCAACRLSLVSVQ